MFEEEVNMEEEVSHHEEVNKEEEVTYPFGHTNPIIQISIQGSSNANFSCYMP